MTSALASFLALAFGSALTSTGSTLTSALASFLALAFGSALTSTASTLTSASASFLALVFGSALTSTGSTLTSALASFLALAFGSALTSTGSTLTSASASFLALAFGSALTSAGSTSISLDFALALVVLVFFSPFVSLETGFAFALALLFFSVTSASIVFFLARFLTSLKNITESGGNVNVIDCSNPCIGAPSERIALPFDIPQPPNSVASVLNISAYVPSKGTPIE